MIYQNVFQQYKSQKAYKDENNSVLNYDTTFSQFRYWQWENVTSKEPKKQGKIYIFEWLSNIYFVKY